MTFYFMGSETCALTPSDSSSYEYTGTGFYNSSFGRCGILIGAGNTTQYVESPAFALPDDFYVHLAFRQGTSGSYTSTIFELYASATAVARLRVTGNSMQMQALISSVWTNVGAAVTYSQSTLQDIDVGIVGNDASGTMTLYLGGTERASGTADLTAVASITSINFNANGGSAGNIVSQVIIASEPTIGMRLATYYPSGAGATVNWTGDYTSIDETVNSDADFVYSGTNGQIELVTGTGPSLTGYTVRAVGVYARSKRGAAGPANLQLALRVNGTDYFSASKAQGIGYDAYGNIWETNPDTTADWLTAAISALQFGVKAIT